MKRNRKIYRWVLLSTAIAILVLAVAAFYTVGVIGKNKVIAQIDMGIGSAESYLKKNQDSSALLTEELKEDYAAKTRTVAMILSQRSNQDSEDRILEELRVTVNAERISVFDPEGMIDTSTDLSGDSPKIREEFQKHLSDSVYTDVLFLLESDAPTIIGASTLENGAGMVQITFPAESVIALLQEADLANTAADVPLYTAGTTAILEADTLKYISCTDASKVGEKVEYDESMFEKNKGRFNIQDATYGSSMLYYKLSGDYIILAVVPYDAIYESRNLLVGWVLVGGALLLLVVTLSLRMGMMPPKE